MTEEMGWRRWLAGLLAAALTGCAFGGGSSSGGSLPGQSTSSAAARGPGTAHWIAGFSVDTPERAAIAHRQGLAVTILYGMAPSPQSALGGALRTHGISVVDAGVSSQLFYWECHRTHTVKPPPSGANDYCATDEVPSQTTPALYARVARALARDARFHTIAGYWVLDDWPWWDPGSARAVLQKIHALIVQATPGRPAVCGFGAGVGPPGKVYWDPGTAANYSNAGCDMVGWYNYSPFGARRPSRGEGLDWSMKALLPAMARSLEKYGWDRRRVPLMGIGQAWSGPYGDGDYQAGLTVGEMRAQARGFCAFGATSIAWYAWDDSGFRPATQTPDDSPTIGAGIAAGEQTCKAIWGG